MNFEHLIQINDPANPLIGSLTRQQLWSGLLQRVENPLPFLPGLEACDILERQGTTLLRALRFAANAVIHDRVQISEGLAVRFDILPGQNHAGGSLTISIEEPQPEHLFLRFAYQTGLGEAGGPLEDKAYAEYVKSAYHQSDVDTVRIIRALAAGGSAN